MSMVPPVKGDRRTVKILLVDDEPALRELLRATFEGADVSVDEAESGLEAEARIRRRRPDVIVLDLRMPVMDGVELCKRLKADPRTKEIPIVFLTGADAEEARRAQRAGAAALVRKPFSPLELLDLVDPGRIEREPGLQYGFLLHDIGKLAIPDQILQKPGPLTSGERRRMQTHTVVGEQMLGGVAVLQGEGLRVVRSHHERWDGRGYPDELAGSDVPLAARVFAVADALDAMTSHRPYRRAIPWRAARDEIVAQSGQQFDPDVVEAFRE